MENNSENLYLVDLSYAKTPADIVFELSTIIEQEISHNKNICLKLGNVDLNQSQLLSIKSLISSINSTLASLSSESKGTELAAVTIGLLVEEIKEKTDDEEGVAETPAAQYIPLTEHLEEKAAISTEEALAEKFEQKLDSLFSGTFAPEKETKEADELKEEITETVQEEIQEPVQQAETTELQDFAAVNDSVKEEEPQETVVEETEQEIITEEVIPETIPPSEEIQAELDSIFDSEAKLENILAEEKNNYPAAKEASQIEIPVEEELTEEDFEIRAMPTKYIKQTVRSGQVVKFDGNLVIIGDCHPGSEVHAQGDITVWGTLGGIAHAGFAGNKKARIRALQLNAIQLRIGDSFARRPDMHNIPYLDKSNSVTPEEARIINNSIVILKLND